MNKQANVWLSQPRRTHTHTDVSASLFIYKLLAFIKPSRTNQKRCSPALSLSLSVLLLLRLTRCVGQLGLSYLLPLLLLLSLIACCCNCRSPLAMCADNALPTAAAWTRLPRGQARLPHVLPVVNVFPASLIASSNPGSRCSLSPSLPLFPPSISCFCC